MLNLLTDTYNIRLILALYRVLEAVLTVYRNIFSFYIEVVGSNECPLRTPVPEGC